MTHRIAAIALALFLSSPTSPAAAGSFVDAVVRFAPGDNAGFGADELPAIVSGPPRGGRLTEGSLDVYALGDGGDIVLRFDRGICNGPGADFIVFENAFHSGTPSGPIFVEAGIVAVSPDDAVYATFPYDPTSFVGLAGRTPVLSHPDNGINPFDPLTAGGDAFDIAELDLAQVSFLRITDGGSAIADPGNRVPPGNSGGFDLDAVAVIHPCEAPAATPTATATATPTLTATPSQPEVLGDADGDAQVTTIDLHLAVFEHFDGDGSATGAVGGGLVGTRPTVDANTDGVLSAADLVAILLRLRP